MPCRRLGDQAFIDCVGARLALTSDGRTPVDLTLFRPATSGVEAHYPNDTVLRLAGQYALYHAFARDFDAPLSGSYQPTADGSLVMPSCTTSA